MSLVNPSSLSGKTVVLAVTGGIAAYKSAYLASSLTKCGARVRTVMTRGATQFVAPLTFQSLTHEPVHIDVFDERDPARIAHISLADEADLVIVAPATADVLARVAHGFGDDMLTAMLLATRAPVIFAPAMNVHMWENAILQENVQKLRVHGYLIAEPGAGPLACGYTGKGRLMEPDDLLEFLEWAATESRYQGLRVLVSAGPTRERIDPVRYLTNDSTGTMGYAIARMAWRMGAEVTLVSGPTSLPEPLGVSVVHVATASEMERAMIDRANDADVVIMTAAVADYRPETVLEKKFKKTQDTLSLALVKNPDILSQLRDHMKPRATLVGFAAETHDHELYARKKLREKRLDFVVLNDVLEPGAGFGTGTNRVTVYAADGGVTPLAQADKLTVAGLLLQLIRTGREV
ncbi:bifunctional phosphopantothenoylcysteine decarboxylase/phosphopantothenate--cysteine ligase CoaBC [Ferroacidibacillus organovorans]|uniref:bifunctional phosphopantothenoylcysteine decarboxylase/phosphopantothenate--cysteine ligase CoaBC n=1 Tax=Ferroacidibacillus organovorans TaxID=1765683 RepID=UPI000A440A53|nr:bifunctional phosphopantothenoylcysteine decarboxylase/phosphopantothenate--cysteine ligase CoaBC [Ferroacidibacillus organovorans]